MKSDNNIFISRDDWESLMFHFPSDSPYGIDVFLESMPEIKQMRHNGDIILLCTDLDVKAILAALGYSSMID